MSVYSEFEKEMQLLQERTAGHPRREMISLFLTALEREELVSVGYRESVMKSRLAATDLPADIKELISNSLLWIWKDEEMHSIYIRGVLMKSGRSSQKMEALLHQFSGAIGGWTSSVLQHTRWSAAPASRGLAETVSLLGVLARKIPKDVRHHLRYGTFRDFCLFNIEAERTAWLCWDRLVELCNSHSLLDNSTIRDFERIAADEENHRRIFSIIADNLTDADKLKEGVSAQKVINEISEVGRAFLPKSLRGDDEVEHPIGSGGRVYVLEDKNGIGATAHLRATLDQALLEQLLQDLAKKRNKRISELKVAVKTTFMLGYHKKDPSPVVSAKLVEALAEFLREKGVNDIAVLESPNLYDRIFANRSVRSVGKYFDYLSDYYQLVDTGEEQIAYDFQRGFCQRSISQTWKDADVRISFSKLRSHPTAAVHLTIGNIDALGTRCDEFVFLERQAQLGTAIIMIADSFPPHFAVLDAYENVPHGVAGIMGCKNPLTPRRFYAARDALALDAVAAKHVGIKDPQLSGILQTACQWFGNPLPKTQVIGEDKPIEDWKGPFVDEVSTALSLVAYPVYELASGRGSLFIPEMDALAFPFFKREGPLLFSVRRALRTIVGLQGIIK